MDETLHSARRAIAEASEATDDREAREQLRSIVEGIDELTGIDDPGPRGDRLEEIEVALTRLSAELSDDVAASVDEARAAIDGYRQEHTIDG